MDIPTLKWDNISKLSKAQMQQVTILSTGKYGIDMRELIERAGQCAADLADHLAPEGAALVVAGRGHNGAGGLAAARILAERGRSVWVVPTHEAENYSGSPKEQLEQLANYKKIRVRSSLPKMKFAVAIDAAIGTNLEGPPRGRTLDVVTVLNNMNGTCVIALDTPTGLISDDGSVPGEVVRADATLSLAMPKLGTEPGGSIGELYIADIGIPPKVYQDAGFDAVKLPGKLTKVVK